jgi:hypothetical protein
MTGGTRLPRAEYYKRPTQAARKGEPNIVRPEGLHSGHISGSRRIAASSDDWRRARHGVRAIPALRIATDKAGYRSEQWTGVFA